MKKISLLLSFSTLALAACAQPALTIYNQNFAVVRDTVPLDLQAGANTVRCWRIAGNLCIISIITKITEANLCHVLCDRYLNCSADLIT